MCSKVLKTNHGFIGWESDDGNLKVVGLDGITTSGNYTFKVTCKICLEDKELFPNGYFISTKKHLLQGKKPCGCGRHPRWTKEQFLLLARRAAKDKFIVDTFAEDFHGKDTKVKCVCLKDHYEWITTLHIINNLKCGCPRCAGRERILEKDALLRCKDICSKLKYIPIGFIGGYKNNRSIFKYICPRHGEREVNYNKFVNHGTQCPSCRTEKQQDNGYGYGWIPSDSERKDYLYILDFDDKFIKIGRSFNVNQRVTQLKRKSGCVNIYKIYCLESPHKLIYDIEQKIIKKLNKRGDMYTTNWSKETFKKESLDFIYSMIQLYKKEYNIED